MTGPARSTTRGRSAEEHAVHYEALRAHVMDGQVLALRQGHAVLVYRGLAAWMDVWDELPVPATSARAEERQPPPPLPDSTSTEVIRVLASMALGQIQEVHP
jgi:hypothetical protein